MIHCTCSIFCSTCILSRTISSSLFFKVRHHSRLPLILELVEQGSSSRPTNEGAPWAARWTASDGEGADRWPTWWQLILGVKVFLCDVLDWNGELGHRAGDHFDILLLVPVANILWGKTTLFPPSASFASGAWEVTSAWLDFASTKIKMVKGINRVNKQSHLSSTSSQASAPGPSSSSCSVPHGTCWPSTLSIPNLALVKARTV